jgi:squalene-associated FAD-dependent desaturase
VKLAIVGAGWAGMAAAVRATQAGHQVTVFEASRTLGGRARQVSWPQSTLCTDNGQHILLGAYTRSLAVMKTVGVAPQEALHRLPLKLAGFETGHGFEIKHPTILGLVLAIARARDWPWHERLSLMRQAAGWRLNQFKCAEHLTVAELCKSLGPLVFRELITPLCESALNTPIEAASARVFLKVLHDALLGVQDGSDVLIPATDLSSLFPNPAARWLEQRGAQVWLGSRVDAIISCISLSSGSGSLRPLWRLRDQTYDGLILATPPWVASKLVEQFSHTVNDSDLVASLRSWSQAAAALRPIGIATVYLKTKGLQLPGPMLHLKSSPDEPAQFVFDCGQLGGPPELWACVVSAYTGSPVGPADSGSLAVRVVQQIQQLREVQRPSSCGGSAIEHFQTVVEKRATFACTPGLIRPWPDIANGTGAPLWACGDYLEGPYPATLESAVRSAETTVKRLTDAYS